MFFLGMAGYSLKLISIVKLIDELSIGFYPILMLIQAFTSYLFISNAKMLSEKFKNWPIFLIGLCTGLIFVSNYNHLFNIEDSYKAYFSMALFLVSTNLLVSFEMTFQNEISKNASVLKNPKMSTWLMFSMEIGLMVSSVLTYFFFSQFNIHIKSALLTLPFAFLGLTYLFLLREKIDSKKSYAKFEKKSGKIDKFQMPCLYPFLSLIVLVTCIKYVQGFSLFFGLFELKAKGNTDLVKIFSEVSFFQTFFIALLFIPKLVFNNLKVSWGKGINIFLTVQAVLFATISFITNPFFLLGSDVVRKIIQHLSLDESVSLLFSSVSEKDRMTMRALSEKYGQFIGYTFLAGFSNLAINNSVPWPLLWGAMLFVVAVTFFVRKSLFLNLTSFQLGNIVRSNLDEAIFSCYSLANKESKIHCMALSNMLNNNLRPELAKAVVYALGEMSDPRSIEYILAYYKKCDSEDLQLSIIQTVVKFKSHRVDHFLLMSLIDMIKNQVSLGEIRRSIFYAITNRLKNVAIPAIFNILIDNDEEHRVLANAVVVLCEIARIKKDPEIYQILSKYLNVKYSRRVRSDAIIGLYHSGKYGEDAMAVLNTYLTSPDQYDKNAVSYIAGKLNLKGFIPFILENSEKANHKTSTLLMALLNLGYPETPKWIARFLVEEDKEKALIAINQLNMVNNLKSRFLVYNEFFKNYPTKVNYLVNLLFSSKRDFELDRRLILIEAKRLHIEVKIEEVDAIKSAIGPEIAEKISQAA